VHGTIAAQEHMHGEARGSNMPAPMPTPWLGKRVARALTLEQELGVERMVAIEPNPLVPYHPNHAMERAIATHASILAGIAKKLSAQKKAKRAAKSRAMVAAKRQ